MKTVAKFSKSLEQLIRTLKVQYNFGKKKLFWFVPEGFSGLIYYSNYNLNGEKNDWDLETYRKKKLRNIKWSKMK